MKVYERFNYTGKEQRWAVPAGVTLAHFECWGAGGGVATEVHYEGKVKQVEGGSAPANTMFYNSPASETQLGHSYSNGSGYVSGDWPVTPGESYYIRVGGNGKPGYSSIKLNASGDTWTVALRGGAGGWNGGGNGGDGAMVYQNLYESSSTATTYRQASMPAAAKAGQRWYDTDAHVVRKCNATYSNTRYTVTKTVLSNNTATITLSSNPGFHVGDLVLVEGVGSNYNGTWTVTAVSGATFSYHNVHSDVSSTNQSGIVIGPYGTQGANWDKTTNPHTHCVGPSGGGGGGATDIRHGGNDLSDRIMVAGGSGGSGGRPTYSGPAAWTYNTVPTTPKPPFGNDTGVTGHTGPDDTWATNTTYFSAGWGHGGTGGGASANPSHVPTINQARVSVGETGGVASARTATGATPTYRSGSGGGGGATAGGYGGAGGTAAPGSTQAGGAPGDVGVGGHGAGARGGYDDFCAGGGGGGGGWYGGGGGGEGFLHAQYTTTGGGGGGGSNYVHAGFTNFVMAGGARPPLGYGNRGTGASGHGGFCRISFNKPPSVKWKSFPTSALLNSSMTAQFVYTPAETDGAGIDHYTIGTATSKTASAPTTTQTIMVPKASTTAFSVNFVAPPTAGTTYAYFVQVTDTDGDTSPWLKQTVTALSVAQTTVPAITAPAVGSTFENQVTMSWTLGNQSPLVAYRTGVQGNDPTVATRLVKVRSPWHRGGSRINFWPDPGFKTVNLWSSTNNTKLGPTTSFPGVSGNSGRISWTPTQNGDAENHTTTFDNLKPGYGYHLHLDFASSIANDQRLYLLQVWDANGLLGSHTVSLATAAAGAYVGVDFHFAPTTQGVYFVVMPSSVGVADDVDPVLWLDFEDGTLGGFSGGTNSNTQANSGTNSLYVTSNVFQTITTDFTDAGLYVAEGWVYWPSASTTAPALTFAGSGITSNPTGTANAAIKDDWQFVQVPVVWDGVGSVVLHVSGDATNGAYWDDITITPGDITQSVFGNVGNGATLYLANGLLEMSTQEDADLGYPAYFDGDNLNGNVGAVSWSGTVHLSPSVLTGTDVTNGNSPVYPGVRLTSGSVFVDTLSTTGVLNGYEGAEAVQLVQVNPPAPAVPVVSLQVNNQTGLMTLSINANDNAASFKTTSFDIFRDGVRIATGLTPDLSTRLATYVDAPATDYTAVYVVRALASNGGYADATTGTVTVVS